MSPLAPLADGTYFTAFKKHESFGVSRFGQTKCFDPSPSPLQKRKKKRVLLRVWGSVGTADQNIVAQRFDWTKDSAYNWVN